MHSDETEQKPVEDWHQHDQAEEDEPAKTNLFRHAGPQADAETAHEYRTGGIFVSVGWPHVRQIEQNAKQVDRPCANHDLVQGAFQRPEFEKAERKKRRLEIRE